MPRRMRRGTSVAPRPRGQESVWRMPRWWRGTLRSGGVRHIGAPPLVRRPRGTLDFGAGKPLHASHPPLVCPWPGELAAWTGTNGSPCQVEHSACEQAANCSWARRSEVISALVRSSPLRELTIAVWLWRCACVVQEQDFRPASVAGLGVSSEGSWWSSPPPPGLSGHFLSLLFW